MDGLGEESVVEYPLIDLVMYTISAAMTALLTVCANIVTAQGNKQSCAKIVYPLSVEPASMYIVS